MASTEKTDYIDLRDVWHRIKAQKRLFLKVWAVTFVVSCALILPVPRTYISEVVLAPETENQSATGTLGSLAASFGLNMSSMTSSDAYYPLLYPDLIASEDFIVSLMDIPVRTADGEIEADYYTYLTQYHKKTFYKIPFIWLKKQLRKIMPKPQAYSSGEGDGRINAFALSEDQDFLVKSVQEMILCSVDKKTDVITITVADQDALVAATMADSVRVRLQKFITDYRTNKARIDMEHYAQLVDEARQSYDEAVAEYSTYSDTHRNASLQAVAAHIEKLSAEMQLRFTTYNAMNTQLEAARAKVQERTPAFTIMKHASVPVKPARPKRMLFVAAMLFLATFGTIGYIFWDSVKAQLVRLH